ncbi:MAG: ATP-binding cassette domain-containing protein [Lachnospiraceae bacterium]
MIQVNDLCFVSREKEILKGITITFEKGKIHGLIGDNGCGKTVFFKCICGILAATGGQITIDGKRIGKDMEFYNGLSYLIDGPGYIPYYSGYKNLCLLAAIKNKIGKEDVKKAISAVGLNPDDRRPVRKYSLGMKQRLGLAQAFMENPPLIVLDEPMNSLDRSGVQLMRQMILEKRSQGATILISSHNEEDIRILCDSIYEMENGQIVNQRHAEK